MRRAAGVLLVALAVTTSGCSGSERPPAATGPTRAAAVPGTIVGFYSAGLVRSDCYGTCTAGQPGHAEQEQNKRRMRELQDLGATFVINNVSVVSWQQRAPAALRAFFADLHGHGLRASYSVASGPEKWFVDGRFDTSQAEEIFRRTDADGDGVSDLDGVLDVLYQGHEVLEWATHAQRVQIYRVAKRWFPTTPVAVYYAAIARATGPAAATEPHRGGPGGVWADYAYGPGEADVVHVGIRRNGDIGTADAAGTKDGASKTRVTEAAKQVVALVRAQTPKATIWVSTNFAGDDQQRGSPDAMWAPQEITAWYDALAAVPEVSGIFLRSYGRFTYDLAHPSFADQRSAFAAAARTARGRPAP